MERSEGIECDCFSSLICSEWYLSLIFPYLVIHEIVKLDSSICNHEDRKSFLICLSNLLHEIDCEKLKKNQNGYIDGMVNWIVNRKLNLFEFVLSTNSFVTFEGSNYSAISSLTKHNPNIKKLILNGPFIMARESYFMDIQCCQLESIIIGFPCVCVPELLMKNYHLKTVHLHFHESYVELFSILGTYCPALEELYVKYGDDEEDALELVDNEIEIFSQGCRNLKSLKINNILNGKKSILVQCLGKYNSKLEMLDISVCNGGPTIDERDFLSPISFEELTKGCPCLKKIAFHYYTILVEVLNMLIDIENITISCCDVSYEDWSVEIRNLTKLKSLKLSSSNVLFVRNISELFFNQTNILEDIGIYGCKQFSDSDLLNIAANCPNLKKLEIRHLNITDQGIVNLFSFQHRTIEDIHISNCKNLSDACLLTIAVNCPCLKKIQFAGLSITDQGIANLFSVQHMRTLENIDIMNCKNLSQHSLFIIAVNCPHFKKIYIHNMKNITVELLWELFHKCEKLIDMTCDVVYLGTDLL